jgi:vitamin B12 transporter
MVPRRFDSRRNYGDVTARYHAVNVNDRAGNGNSQDATAGSSQDTQRLLGEIRMSKSVLVVASCAAAATSFLSTAAIAAEGPEEVLVTSTRLEESLPVVIGQYGSRVEVFTAEQVRRTGSYDVAGALQQLAPGLYISPKNGAFDYIDASLQGSRTADILWLVDGVRINNRLYATTTPLDTIPANVVERLEVLEGGQGLFYGTQAVAGVVNVVTKAFTGELSGDVSVGTDSEGGRALNGFVRGGGAGHEFVLYASKDEGDGFQPYRDQDIEPSATDRERGYDVLTLGGKYAYDFSEDVRVSLNYQHTDAELDFLQPTLVARQVNSRDEDLITAKLDWRLGERTGFYLKAYYHDWDTRYDTYLNTLTTPGEIEVESENAFWGFWDYGVNALLQFRPGEKVEYSVGYDLQNYWGRDDVWRIDDKTERTHALFAQVRSTPELFRNAKLAAGVRYTAPSEGEASTVWTASGQYDFSNRLFVRGNIGGVPTAVGRGAVPDRAVLPRQSGPRAGAQSQRERLDRRRRADPRVGSRGLPARHRQPHHLGLRPHRGRRNGGEHRQRGSRARCGADPEVGARGLDVRDAQLHLQPRPLGRQRPADRRDSRATPEAGRGLSDGSLAARRDARSAARRGRLRPTFLGPQNHGDYTVVDVSARYWLSGDRHRVDARITNLFDQEYASSLGNAERDADGSRYVYWNVGAPRSLGISYTYAF